MPNQPDLSFEVLNAEKIKAFLSIETKRLLSQIDIFDSLDSTNNYLLTVAKAKVNQVRVCLAETQTAGRGRQGKTWLSPKGANIYASLLWPFSTSQGLSGLSLAIAVMLSRALNRYGIAEGLELKWPNDILYKGRKLAGILIEGIQSFDQSYHCVIGVGISCDKEWVDFFEITGKAVARNALAGLIIDELVSSLPEFAESGLPAFIQAFRQQDGLVNKNIAVQEHNQIITGVADGISDAGELLLRQEDGAVLAFRCGEVSVKVG